MKKLVDGERNEQTGRKHKAEETYLLIHKIERQKNKEKEIQVDR
jgi:hypothetical protein